jgi:hypothetical protein
VLPAVERQHAWRYLHVRSVTLCLSQSGSSASPWRGEEEKREAFGPKRGRPFEMTNAPARHLRQSGKQPTVPNDWTWPRRSHAAKLGVELVDEHVALEAHGGMRRHNQDE